MLESLVIHHQQTALLFHATTEWLALSGGFMLYNHIRKRRGHPSALASKGGIWVLAFCLLGAGIGNKLVSILQFPEYWALAHSNPKQFWLVVMSGQSVVGGLLGGWAWKSAKKLAASPRARATILLRRFCSDW